MKRALLVAVCLILCAACQGSGHETATSISPPPIDFSGFWNIQMVILEDECGFCPTGTPITEGLKIDQIQDSVAATLSGHSLRMDGSGFIAGTTMNLTFNGEVFVNSWFFINSPASASCSLSNGTISGAFFIQLGALGQCCNLCCGDGQCLCRAKDCRVPLPDCKMSFTFSGYRIQS